MARYCTQVVSYCDNTSYAAYSCIRSCTINTVAYGGTCVFQLTGGTAGCATVGNYGSGNCCLWIVPANVSQVLIEIWGGGGGGGAIAVCCCCTAIGTGGGGGAYSRVLLSVTPGQGYTVCAGAGGCGGLGGCATPTVGACCCGNRGVTTFVTGLGLSNFCAEGGWGGESRIAASTCQSVQTPNGGFPGLGGSLNARGYDGGHAGGMRSSTQCMGYTYGGGSPFGGRNTYMGFDYCSLYTDSGGGNQKYGGICGFSGSFPGGGGTGAWNSCCCTICACGGNGAPGLVRIWM